MSDTAIPMPDPALTDTGALTPDQQRRVQALSAARSILATRPAVFGSSSVQGWTIGDLTFIAEWVLNGPSEPDVAPSPDGYWAEAYAGKSELDDATPEPAPAELEQIDELRFDG